MFRDSQTALWEAAALTSTAVSTNAYDLGAVPTGSAHGDAIDPSVGEPLCVVLSVGVAADHTTGDETYEFDIITATASNLTSSATTLAQYVLSYALLTAGALIVLPIPQGAVVQRYLGAKYIGGGTTPTITVTAWIAPMSMIQKTKNYTTAIVVN